MRVVRCCKVKVVGLRCRAGEALGPFKLSVCETSLFGRGAGFHWSNCDNSKYLCKL